MAIYHISHDGVARVCRASDPSGCRVKLGASIEHYDTKEEAQSAYEKSQEKENFYKLSKNPSKNTERHYKNISEDNNPVKKQQKEKTKSALETMLDDELAANVELSFEFALESAEISPHLEKQGYVAANKHYKKSLESLQEAYDDAEKSNLYNGNDLDDFEEALNIKKFQMEEKLVEIYKKDNKPKRARLWDSRDKAGEKHYYNQHIKSTMDKLTNRMNETKKSLPQYYIKQRIRDGKEIEETKRQKAPSEPVKRDSLDIAAEHLQTSQQIEELIDYNNSNRKKDFVFKHNDPSYAEKTPKEQGDFLIDLVNKEDALKKEFNDSKAKK